MPAAKDPTHDLIQDFLREVGAMDKAAADPLSEPGSVGGETEHPVKDVDDGLQVPKEGDRAKENERDVKAEQAPAGVNSASDVSPKSAAALFARFAKAAEGRVVNPPGTAHEDHVAVSTNVQPTGEDPENETEGVKATKDDPGSTHPARTDNDELDGHKYAAELASYGTEKLAAAVRELGNDLCAYLTVAQEKAASAPAPASRPSEDPAAAFRAGYGLAKLAAMDKRAADAMVQDALAGVVKQAWADGHDAADFLDAYLAEKRAGGEGLPPAEGAPGAGGPPPGGGGEDLMAALGGGGGAPGGPPPGAGGPPPGAGGPPPGPAMPAGPGGPPPGAEGGDGDGDEGGDPAGGGHDPAQLAQVIQQLGEQLGVTPEELQAALSEMVDQNGVGGHEVAASDRGRRPARGKAAAAKAGNASRATEDLVKELFARSRR